MELFNETAARIAPRNPDAFEEAPWDIEIGSRRFIPPLRLEELWQYKRLIGILIYRDFVVYCKQTILGPLWWIMQPVITCGVFVIIFSRIMHGRTDSIPPTLFFLSGLIIWFFFSNTFSGIARTFSMYESLFTRVYFPRLAMPVSQVCVNLIKFGLQFAFFSLIYLIFIMRGTDVRPGPAVLLVPVVVLYVAMLAAGFGLLFNSITYKYRDLALILPFLLQMGMFVSAIIHPVSRIPEKLIFITYINPVIPAVEMFRYSLFGIGTFSLSQVAVSLLVGFAALAVGLISFAHTNQVFVDNV